MLIDPIYFLVLFDVDDPKKVNTHRYKRIEKHEFELILNPETEGLFEPWCVIISKMSFFTKTTTDQSFYVILTVKYIDK